MYKYTHELYDVNKSLVHFSDNVSTRGHNFKLEKWSSKLDIRKFFFTYRTVNMWNELPSEIVNAFKTEGSTTSSETKYISARLYFIKRTNLQKMCAKTRRGQKG